MRSTKRLFITLIALALLPVGCSDQHPSSTSSPRPASPSSTPPIVPLATQITDATTPTVQHSPNTQTTSPSIPPLNASPTPPTQNASPPPSNATLLNTTTTPNHQLTPTITGHPTSPPTPSQPSSSLTPITPTATIAQRLSQSHNLTDPTQRAALVTELKSLEQKEQANLHAKAKRLGIPTSGTRPDGTPFLLRDFEGDTPIYESPENINAAITTAADRVRSTPPFDVTGANLTVGIWESGGIPRVSHQEFGGRVTVVDGSTTTSSHATHVTGTVAAAGINPQTLGMAPQVTVQAYSSTSDVSEMTAAGAASSNEPGKIQLSNHSYGTRRGWFDDGVTWLGTYSDDADPTNDVDFGFGRYDTSAVALDGLTYNLPYYLPFFSNGNQRNNGPPATGATWYQGFGGTTRTYDPARHPPGNGAYKQQYDTMDGRKTAKNIMSIGAINDAVSAGQRFLPNGTLTSFSSSGPTDDGRIKPDLVANGASLTSTSNASDTATSVSSGTSMSTPNAMGSTALLLDYYKQRFPGQTMRASTIKALLLHTADDLGTPGPDYLYGWGLMNTLSAAQVIKSHAESNSNPFIIENRLNSTSPSRSHPFTWNGIDPIRVTLSWTDPASTASTNHDDRTPRLVNDLNLTLTGPASTTHLPFVMPYVGNWTNAMLTAPATTGVNTVDTAEQIFLPAPSQPGLYTATVNHTGILTGSQQHYSLIITGGGIPDLLTILPANGLNSEGEAGGPFAPSSETYTLSNSDSAPTAWTAAVDAPWVTLSQPGSTLLAGQSATLTASINSSANSLPLGLHTATLTLTDTTRQTTRTRLITLNVRTYPIISAEHPENTPLQNGLSRIDFGSPLIKTTSKRRLLIRNSGVANLNIGARTFEGHNASDFTASSPTLSMVPPNGTSFIDITFAPSTPGPSIASLSIANDDPDANPLIIDLTGNALDTHSGITFIGDLNSVTAGVAINSTASVPLAMDTYVLFAGNSPLDGNEMWRTDGTVAGTYPLTNLTPSTNTVTPTNLTRVGNRAFFSANDGISGTELYVTDGTIAGTQLVRDINPGLSSSSPSNLTVLGSTLYFTANTSLTGTELWKTDGTAAGTLLVTDLNPGSLNSSPSSLVAFQNRIFFAATTSDTGTELYSSDGTTAGTFLVRDISSGFASSSPTSLTVVGSDLFFAASNSDTELWKTNGTFAGTQIVLDIAPGFNSSSPAGFIVLNNILYFRATTSSSGTELWRSDGTPTGTFLVNDINPGTNSGLTATPTVYNNKLYFSASNGSSGSELWTSDGTNLGTTLLSDIYPGSVSSTPTNFRIANNQLFFSAFTLQGRELWKTDGTNAGTVLLRDINPGSLSSSPAQLTNFNGLLIFAANDGLIGLELWRSDGTTAGTIPIHDTIPGTASSSLSSLTNINGSLHFAANTGSIGNEPWRIPTTTTTPTLIRDIATGSLSSTPSAFILAPNNTHTLFSANAGTTTGTELWISDGSNLGTSLLMDINPGSSSSFPANFRRIGNQVFFTATNSLGSELWTTDGTAAGTRLVRDINPGSSSSSPSQLTIYQNVLYFRASNGTVGTELWRSDGTTAGTYLLKDIRPGPFNSTPLNFAILDGLLYFSAYSEEDGYELWRTDGTSDGTLQVASLMPGINSSSPSNLTPVASTLFFSATTPSGTELWKYDPLSATASQVVDLVPGSASSSPSQLTANNGRLLFAADDGQNGRELWVSDGTSVGTNLLKDIYPGSDSSTPASLTPMGEIVCFTATNGTNGREMWQTDGTPEGTILLADLNPGFLGSNPAALTPVGPLLYFTATLLGIGTELFMVEPIASRPVLQVYAGPSSGPALLPNAGPVNFGFALLGQRQTRTFAIRNIGNLPLSITNLETTGDWQIDTQRTNTQLAPRSLTTFIAHFSPTGAGTRVGSLTIQSNDPFHPSMVLAFNGTGIDSAPGLPVIGIPPAHHIVRPGARVNLFTVAVGTPPLTYQWSKNGRPISGASSSLFSIPSVSSSTAGLYTVSVSSKQKITSPATFLTIVPDIPKSHLVQAGKSITFTSGDSGPTTFRVWTLNGAPLPSSPRFSLTKNGQILTIKNLQANDSGIYQCNVSNPAGTLSTGPISLNVIDAPPTIITPLAIPSGIVGAAFAYQVPINISPSRQPNRFGAKGLPPSLSIDPITGIISGYPTRAGTYQVTITAANSLGSFSASQAVQIAPLPINIAGSYSGLVSRHPILNDNLGGRLDFTITESSSVSGSLELGSTKLAFRGRVIVDPNGILEPRVTISIPSPNNPTSLLYTLDFNINRSQGVIETGGIVSDASSSALLEGWLNPWNLPTRPASALAAYYTFILKLSAIDQGNVAIPQGDSFGSFKVSPSGQLQVTARLADGTPFTLSSFVGPGGQIALFRTLYSKPLLGSLIGRLTVDLSGDPESALDNSLSGRAVTWSRPAIPGLLYPEGFTPRSLDTFGGAFTPPPLLLNITPAPGSALLNFYQANISQSATPPNRTLAVGLNNRITILPSASLGTTTLNVTPATGTFSGAFTLIDPHWQSPPPATWRRTSTYQGITIKNGPTYSGHGHFLLPQLPTSNPKTSPPPTLSGQVQLQTVP